MSAPTQLLQRTSSQPQTWEVTRCHTALQEWARPENESFNVAPVVRAVSVSSSGKLELFNKRNVCVASVNISTELAGWSAEKGVVGNSWLQLRQWCS